MIKARNIIKSYQNGESRFQVLKDISLDIEDNDFVVILGASGSGKSTFLNVISGLERPDSGKVFYDGKNIKTSLERLDSEKNYINIPANFRVANSKEYLLQELWQKDREYYFLTNRQEH